VQTQSRYKEHIKKYKGVFMPLNGAIINSGATVSATGGSACTFTTDGQTITNGLHLIDAAVTDFRVQPSITVKVKRPSLNSLGVYSKGKISAVIKVPIILASGATSFELMRIERESHPENTAAARLDLNVLGAQILADSDFAALWASGSTA
jgi:hypothetical protein